MPPAAHPILSLCTRTSRPTCHTVHVISAMLCKRLLPAVACGDDNETTRARTKPTTQTKIMMPLRSSERLRLSMCCRGPVRLPQGVSKEQKLEHPKGAYRLTAREPLSQKTLLAAREMASRWTLPTHMMSFPSAEQPQL